MLEIDNLQSTLMKPVSMTLKHGECISIEGPSGSGKTVFLRALADLDRSTGAVKWNETRRSEISAPHWRKIVRYAAAEPGFWGETVAGHFTDKAIAVPLLESLGLTAEAIDWPVERLSTGEKQRIGLAIALEDNPPVILVDEPTAALDAKAAAKVETLLTNRLDAGAAIIMVSHDPEFARRLATRQFHIENGELSEVFP